MEKVGVCWFDDDLVATEAWISVDGSSPEKIAGIGNLSYDVLWVTNLSYKAYRKLNLHNSQNIYDTQFFRTSIKILAHEYGLESDPARFAEVASKILTRVLGLGKNSLGISVENKVYRYTSLISDCSLPRTYTMKPFGKNQVEISEAFKQATQANQAMSGRNKPAGSKTYNFTFPKSAYAKWILGQQVPVSDKWEKLPAKYLNKTLGVEDNNLVGATKTNREKLMSLGEKSAAIFRISVLGTEKTHSDFSYYGSGVFHNRGWATLPEVLEISRYSKVHIHYGYESELGSLEIPDGVDIDAGDFSVSKGLFLENFWVGLTSTVDSGKFYTSLGAFLRAYDRIACGRAAEVFARNSFVVGSYGTGRVVVCLRKSQFKSAVGLARECGLMPPIELCGTGY